MGSELDNSEFVENYNVFVPQRKYQIELKPQDKAMICARLKSNSKSKVIKRE
jgi:hypothetical protein